MAKYEEELHWRNVQVRLEYLAAGLPDRRQKVDQALSTLRQALAFADQEDGDDDGALSTPFTPATKDKGAVK